MKKLLAICFAGSMLTVGAAWAQDATTPAPDKKDAMSDSAKAAKVTGKISDDGKSFTTDADSKAWTITNPDAVKGHEGHHVVLMAQVDADKSEVRVVSLKMAK